MKNAGKDRLWQQLQEARLVSATAAPAAIIRQPWFVRIMLGFAGWIGALFLLGFIATTFALVMKSASASLLVGALGCAGAGLIFRKAREKVFATQFGLALGLAGQLLFIFGLHHQFQAGTALLYLFILLFEGALTLLLPNFISRFLTSWGALLAFSLLLIKVEAASILPGVIAAAFAFIWLNELRWATHGAIVRPLAYSLTLSLLQLQTLFFGNHHGWLLREVSPRLHLTPWLGKGLLTAILLVVVLKLLVQEGIELASHAGATLLAITVLVLTLAFPATGVATALLILMVGYNTSNRILGGLGILAMAGFLSFYYYQLESTLLTKSLLLIASGGALLLVRLAARREFPLSSEEKNA